MNLNTYYKLGSEKIKKHHVLCKYEKNKILELINKHLPEPKIKIQY